MISIFIARPNPVTLRQRTSGWRQILVWLPAVFAVCVIAMESTDTFSAEHTSSWLRPIIERLFGHIADQRWDLFHHIARKSGHFCGYGLVCLAFLRAWLITLGKRVGLSLRHWLSESNGLAVCSTALVASLDEWHQTFIPSRTGKVTDVLLDTTGGVVLCAVATWLRWMMQRKAAKLEVLIEGPVEAAAKVDAYPSPAHRNDGVS